MKFIYASLFLLIANTGLSQQWQAEIMGGVSGYNGDLSQKALNFKTIGPAGGVAIKYSTYNNFLVFRLGFNYGKISGNDADNKDLSLIRRNLNFKTDIIEATLCAEYNILDPAEFAGYPYAFGGIGFFRFNPYTYDKDNKKVYLQPLGTEGQGLTQFPDRKMYSLNQFCLPFGVGWKMRIDARYSVAYELGARFLLTDYLDDVSKTYPDPEVLSAVRGPTAAELSFRKTTPTGIINGLKRGNPKVKDQYYFTGIKLVINLGPVEDY